MDEKTKQKVIGHYDKGEGSIQDIARVYKVTVEEVLAAIGQPEVGMIETQGDLIDQSEAGPEVKVNPLGTPAKQHFTVD